MSESRRRKLEFLTRSIAHGDMAAAQRLIQPAPVTAGPCDAEPLPLEQAIGGCSLAVSWDGRSGDCWLVRRTLAEVSTDLADVSHRYAAVLRGARQRFDEIEASAELCHIANARPEDLLFLDLETCGLGGTPIFLVGLMSFRDEQLVFEQLLARDYSQEAAILLALAERMAGMSVLVTFNGKAFDMTQVAERSAFHGIVPPDGPAVPHLDLLHEARRRWRKDLPNCRLQTLERVLCGRHRTGDIPGWAIPEAYHKFVADQDARALRDILHHNMLDLLTMSELLCALLAGDSPLA